MDIKRAISRIAYHIEEKPEGGFIARCVDPTVPSLEAPSRFELEQQIQAKITAEIESQFPRLKIHLDQSATKFITLETKPGGAFPGAQHSSMQLDESGIKNALEHWLADKAVSIVEKNLSPELLDQLVRQNLDGKINITLTKTGAGGKVERDYVVSNGNEVVSHILKGTQQPSSAIGASNPVSTSFSGTNLDSTLPITPESGRGTFFRFIVAAIILIGFLFFFLYLKK